MHSIKKNVSSFITEYSKKPLYRKLIMNSTISNTIFKNPVRYLIFKKNSVRCLKNLLRYKTLNSSYVKNFFKNSSNKITNLNVDLNFKKNYYISKNRFKQFYLNSILDKKSGYFRSFSKINEEQVIVKFKKSNVLQHISLLKYSKINNLHFIPIVFNIISTNYSFNYFKTSFFNSNIRPSYYSIKTSYSFSAYNSIYFSMYKDFILTQHLNVNLNNLFYELYSFKNNFSCNISKDLNNSLINNHIKLLKNFDDSKYYNSVVWSSFWNTLFLSKTKNISEKSLYVSIVYFKNQDFFLFSNAFFSYKQADDSIGNAFVDTAPFTKYSDFNRFGLSSLTLKYNSFFFNGLKWRKSTPLSNFALRSKFLLKYFDKSFLCLFNKSKSDKIFYKVSILSNILKNSNSTKNIYISNLNNVCKLKNKFSCLLNCLKKDRILKTKINFFYKNIYNSLKTNVKHFLLTTKLSFESNFRVLPSIRHRIINEEFSDELSIYGNTESSTGDVLPEYFDELEAFKQNFRINNYKNNNNQKNMFLKNMFLQNLFFNNRSFFSLRKISDFLNLISTPFEIKLFLKDVSFSKNSLYTTKFFCSLMSSLLIRYISKIGVNSYDFLNTNLIPDNSFKFTIFKKVSGFHAEGCFTTSLTTWHYHSIIRFMEFCSGRKALFQFYPFITQSIEKYYILTYKRWMTRMRYYERKLGHRFFLEEALHLIHLTLNLHDPKIMCTWLKAMIERISFWKTRSIFRFLRYLFNQYLNTIMSDIGSKGLKICLRGKISVSGNSRTRTILYRTGQTSHANTSLKVLNEFMTIDTFTGVMGFQLWIFY